MIELTAYYITHTGRGDEVTLKLAIPRTDNAGQDQLGKMADVQRTTGKIIRVQIELDQSL